MDTGTATGLIFRLAAASIGGMLVKDGIIGNADQNTVVGALIIILTGLWSWWQKRGQQQLLAAVTKAGGFVHKDAGTTDVNTAAKVIAASSSVITALLIAVFVFVPGFSYAQTAPRVQKSRSVQLPFDPLKLNKPAAAPNAVVTDLQTLWQKITTATATDLQYASAMAANANTAASKVRKQCWDAIMATNAMTNGSQIKNADGSLMARPDPALFTNAESLAEVIDNLSPQGTLFTSCAGAAELAKMNTLAFINALITGVATFTATGL